MHAYCCCIDCNDAFRWAESQGGKLNRTCAYLHPEISGFFVPIYRILLTISCADVEPLHSQALRNASQSLSASKS